MGDDDQKTRDGGGQRFAGADQAQEAAIPGVVAIFSQGQPINLPIPIHNRRVEIGRGVTYGATTLEDHLISRNHTAIEWRGTEVRVTDLGSRNYTFIDGRRVKDEVFQDMPRILRMGSTLFRFTRDIRPFLKGEVSIRDNLVIGPTLREVYEEIASVAAAGETLLLTGPSGSGKELAARAFHAASKPAGPFVAVNCAAIRDYGAERELFGERRQPWAGPIVVKGLIQTADRGTLFLEEIAELDPSVQAKLLRVLETREVMPLGASAARKVDIRLCTATLKDLGAEVAAGRFRKDLYFRIHRPMVCIPSLVERLEELPWLARAELQRMNPELVPSAGFLEACALRSWPGNVRELLQELYSAGHAALNAGRSVVEAIDLSPTADQDIAADLWSAKRRVSHRDFNSDASPLASSNPLPPLPSDAILAALRQERGNVTRAARSLGVHRTQLRRMVTRLGIDPAAFRGSDGGDESVLTQARDNIRRRGAQDRIEMTADPRAKISLDVPASITTAIQSSRGNTPGPVLGPGILLANEFRLIRLIHSGEQRIVFLAEQISTGNKCAIKGLVDGSEADREAILGEARALLRIPTDHVAQVLGMGGSEPGQTPWFAMELLEGEDLQHRIRREGHLELGEAMAILEQVCHGLDAAHRRGISHGNLNPSNIFIAQSGGGYATTKILGFGLARWKQWRDAVDRTRAFLEASLFTAPERLLFRRSESAVTNVWGLGLIAFELLTGKSYWKDTMNLQSRASEVLSGPYEPASARARELKTFENLPEGFDDWFARCVVRETTARFSTAGEALVALRSLILSNRIKPVWSVSLDASLTDVDEQELQSAAAYLRQVSGDPDLTLRRAVNGSVVLILEGSHEGYRVIRSMMEARQLTEVLGIRIADVQWRSGQVPGAAALPTSSSAPIQKQTQSEENAGPRPSAPVSAPVSAQAFISYSHKDEALCDELLVHLAVLRRQGLLREWYDRRVLPGVDWSSEVHKGLEESRVILLLVSADFLASDYCYEVEVRRAIEKHACGEARVIPVLVRACEWEHARFAHLQVLPQSAMPVTSWPNRDEAWYDVVRGIRKAVHGLTAVAQEG